MTRLSVILSLILSAIFMSGCAKDEAPVVTMVEPEPVSLPAECTAPDSSWVSLPDKDIKRSEAAKNYDTNKRQYTRIITRRNVCRAAINALKG